VAQRSSVVRVQPFDRQPCMPWRNGGGHTREICAWPPGAGIDDFAWRVSVATIARDGPFSRFPGIVRTAVLLDGAGLRLRAGADRVELAGPYAQATFDGALPWQCELRETLVQVFNVMVREGLAARVTLASGTTLDVPRARFRVVYAARGSADGEAAADAFALAEGDACLVDDASALLRVRPIDARSHALVATIDAPADRA
jgi:environmental stress-induced protein Ves